MPRTPTPATAEYQHSLSAARAPPAPPAGTPAFVAARMIGAAGSSAPAAAAAATASGATALKHCVSTSRMASASRCTCTCTWRGGGGRGIWAFCLPIRWHYLCDIAGRAALGRAVLSRAAFVERCYLPRYAFRSRFCESGGCAAVRIQVRHLPLTVQCQVTPNAQHAPRTQAPEPHTWEGRM